MLLFFLSTVWLKSLKLCAVSQHGLSVASRPLAQYCETGGAVDSLSEGFFNSY